MLEGYRRTGAERFSLGSVAGNLADAAEYDVHIVRYFSPTAIQEMESVESYPGETE